MATGKEAVETPQSSGGSTIQDVCAFISTAVALPLGLRIFSAFFGHSGEGQLPPYEGAPYGGDYEAQRHWMELTLHLPVGKWYFYDLQYWGLDYPPLTAYVSQACGWVSNRLDPASMALDTSRGFEMPWHKAFMRLTVLVCDLLVYFPPVWLIAAKLAMKWRQRLAIVALALCHPALILIDHGHFQYNSVSLGFSLFAFHFFAFGSRPGIATTDLVGAVFFCLALNFKQMSLYHAPAVFFFLLGRCFAAGDMVTAALDIAKLGFVVLLSFAVLWWPFCVYATDDVGCAGGLLQVLKRLFPFDRGVFEDKVANLWFVLSVKPISLRSRLPDAAMPKLALLSTITLFALPCWCLFKAGLRSHQMPDRGIRALLWGSTACALAFFLASFQKLLPTYYIGEIEDYKVSKFVQEHREIRQELLRQGLFETRPSFYLYKGIWYASLFVGALFFTIMRRSVPEHMLGAFLFACFWQQLAFFGHDIGHNAVSHSRKDDLWWGTAIGNITGGISLAWWKRSHNVHHIVCNSIEDDPDIQHMPIFAIVPDIFGRFWSTYHEKWVVTDWFARLLVSHQHWLYYPIMAFARFNLYVQSYILMITRPKEIQLLRLEVAGLLGFAAWFSFMVYTCMDSWAERLAFLLISHGIAGILHVQITLSHFAEDTYHGKAYNDDSDEWFRMQVVTTLNVDCPTWMDWFHGGLQFQVEHHLYPRLPRHNLRKAREMVKEFCAKHDVKYKELPFFQGNLRVLAQLRKTALEARKLTKGNGGFYTSQLYQSLNAFG